MTSYLSSATSLAESTASLLSEDFAGGAVNLDFDLTFLIQMGAFAILAMVLRPILFDPLLKLFEERERRTEGAKVLARKMDEKAGEILQRYEAELETVRRTAAEERERLRAEGSKLEAQILAEGRAEVAALVEQGRARLEADRKVLRAELSTRAADIARDIASRVLGREVA
ncbi:MAG: H(+)-transporting ATPase [Polyangiaceae bacterium]